MIFCIFSKYSVTYFMPFCLQVVCRKSLLSQMASTLLTISPQIIYLNAISQCGIILFRYSVDSSFLHLSNFRISWPVNRSNTSINFSSPRISLMLIKQQEKQYFEPFFGSIGRTLLNLVSSLCNFCLSFVVRQYFQRKVLNFLQALFESSFLWRGLTNRAAGGEDSSSSGSSGG